MLTALSCARGDTPALILADVPGQLKALAALATSLEAAGVDASRERSTLWTATFFAGAIGSDFSNASSLARIFSAWLACTPANVSCGDIAAALAAALPSLETASLQSVLADALAAGDAVLSAPSKRLPPRPLNASALALIDGYLRDATGAPALVTGFNDMDPAQLLQGSGAISALSLGLNDASISARWSGLDENGTVPASTIAGLVDQFCAAAAAGYTLEVFVGQGSGDLPSWLEDKFPGLTNCTNKFIGYDIDHPGATWMLQQLLGGVAAGLASAGISPLWMLANEPYFPNATSRYSIASYASWLADAYGGNVSALNAAWGRNFSSFADLGWLDLQAYYRWSALPLAEKADFAAWNRARVVRWAAVMHDAIAAQYPPASPPLTAIKLINEMSNFDVHFRNVGIDKAAIGALLGVSGCDTRIVLPASTFPSIAQGAWRCPAALLPDPAVDGAVAIGWTEVTMSYDLQRSLQPRKAIVDSEWHMASDDGFYVPSIPRGHAVAGLWLSALSGLSATVTWYWPRRGADAPPPASMWAQWFPYSIATQPSLLDGMARAHFDVNALAALLPPLTMVGTRPLRLLYSEASGALDIPGYLCVQIAAYEAAASLGVPTGFIADAALATPAGCADLLASAPSGHLLLLPNVSFIGDAAVACIAAYAAAGGALAVVGAPPNSTALAFSERGAPRAPADFAFLARARHLPLQRARAMFRDVEAAASAAGVRALVRCIDAADGAATAWGVFCRSTPCDADGVPAHEGALPPGLAGMPPCRATVFLVNTRDANAAVALEAGGALLPRALSLLDNTTLPLGSAGLTLPSLGVRVLLVDW